MKDVKLLKYVGSKAKVLDQIVPVMFDRKYKRYIEPMCGSAVVALDVLAHQRAESVLLADSNARLITMWRMVRDHSAILLPAIQKAAELYDKASVVEQEEIYFRWRAELNSNPAEIRMAVLMLLINRTCFNGLYRENANGSFNVSWGRRKTASGGVVQDAIRLVAPLLRGVSLSCGDFKDLCVPHPGDCWFFDPPYDDTFDSYGAWRGDLDLLRLRDEALRIAQSGARVFITNARTAKVKALFANSIIHEVHGNTCVSQTNGSRGETRELLIEVRP